MVARESSIQLIFQLILALYNSFETPEMFITKPKMKCFVTYD